jgi:hypothetical protein
MSRRFTRSVIVSRRITIVRRFNRGLVCSGRASNPDTGLASTRLGVGRSTSFGAFRLTGLGGKGIFTERAEMIGSVGWAAAV